jgi:hypothetical protein
MSNSILELEKVLFEKWENKIGPIFCRDGVIEEEFYLKSKVVFLMKEVNAKGKALDLKYFLNAKKGKAQTWDNVSRWIYGLLNRDREIEWTEINSDHMASLRPEMLRYACVVNLKKTSGGGSTVKQELREQGFEDKDLIVDQLNLYDPKIIIGCGSDVTDVYKVITGVQKEDWKQTRRGIWYIHTPGRPLYISYIHPEARVKDCLIYYGLIDAVKEILI